MAVAASGAEESCVTYYVLMPMPVRPIAKCGSLSLSLFVVSCAADDWLGPLVAAAVVQYRQ